ncbi:uncharacterized protein LOC115438906 [Sphaeramia orbicularis]|uniref:uncharacterized protein LOC115438906 n=1 Tax=Sphaeramia orbicularis TaxID=375764 RepID=UPI0011804562|nr:uncharacterized protein LOC115438906 [Sphaeramia orbicularis]
MKLLLSSLLLASLCALSSWSVSSGTLVVTQSPDTTVTEGETVNITCCWKNKTEVWVNWLKNEIRINKTQRINKIETFDQNANWTKCSTLTLKNVKKEDSARYTCIVTMDIPVLQTASGEGTVITIESGQNTDEHSGNPKDPDNPLQSVYIALGVVAPLLLITLICFCRLRSKEAQAARVIYEVPHVDSETQDVDKHSDSSSRGSSQWCQVLVYESFDYFERVETQKSG